MGTELHLNLPQSLVKWIDPNFVKDVSLEDRTSDVRYIPQLSIHSESRTIPLKIVLDCSVKMPSTISLNDCRYKGPSIVEKLGRATLKFRTNRLVVTADMPKTFLWTLE